MLEKPKIKHFDELMCECEYCDTDTEVNSGFECHQPKNGDKETIDGQERGQCYLWACPIATELCPRQEGMNRKLLDATFGVDGWKNRQEHYMLINEKEEVRE